MDVEQGGGARYAAFISYSHKDAAFGRWLHRRLEGYRLPRRLAGSQGERGLVPQRLTPIFRDREELPAAGDLSERVRAALQVSGSLIVVCSPNSAASPWVAKEIETFRTLHPDRPVLAAIVDGEPCDCFPSAIRAGAAGEIEPLAADFRKDADGRRLALLKLVAGIAGIGLDQLVQRDAQRRLRRVTAVTLLALIGMLVTAALAIVAINARAEAQRQKHEAEGLIEFMLTDLRDRLKEAGRLDALTEVNEKALAYYGARSDLDQLPEESLARRARIFHLMAEDNLSLDQPKAALASFEEASRITAEQLSRAPTSRIRILLHTRSLAGLSKLYERQRDWRNATRYAGALARLTDRLLIVDPKNPAYNTRAATAAMSLANLHLRHTKQFGEAQKYYEQAVQRISRAEHESNGDHHTGLKKANAIAGIADSFYYRKSYNRSLHYRLMQIAIVRKLYKPGSNNREIEYFLAAAERGLAYSLSKTGKPIEARDHLVAAALRMDSLTAIDPANKDWRDLRSTLTSDLAELDKARRVNTVDSHRNGKRTEP